jgi:tRNA (adenine37-N6)-methyltransferase
MSCSDRNQLTIRPIAYIHSDFKEKFGIPRQPGLVPGLESVLEFESEFSNPDFIRGIEDFDYLWVVFGFSQNWNSKEDGSLEAKWSPLVRPPRLGGQKKKGVFATRSPYRPNGLGMSCLRLIRVERDNGVTRIIVGGADLLDETPIYDIKPYIAYSDAKPDARSGFATPEQVFLQIDFPEKLLSKIPEKKRKPLIGVLEQDPRDGYAKKPRSVYGLRFADCDIRFTVEGDVLHVIDVDDASAVHVK